MLGDFRNPYHSKRKVKDVKANLERFDSMGTPFIDFKLVAEQVRQNIEAGLTEIREVFGTVNLKEVVLSEYTNEDFFSCPLIYGNRGWFHVDSLGIWRYSSKSSRYGDVVDFDITDFWAIKDNMTKKEKLTELSVLFNLPLVKSVEVELERLVVVEESFKLINESTSIISEQAKTIYEIMLIEARDKAVHQRQTKSGINYFYVDLTSIQEHLLTSYGVVMNRGSISRYINYLTTLGVINKVPLKEVETKDRNVAIAISEEQRRYSSNYGKYITYKNNTINFYHLPTLNVEEVEYLSEKLKHSGTPYYKISRHVVEDIFGAEKMKEVYPEYKHQNIKKSKFEEEKRTLKKRFFVLLKTQGYVAKSQLEGILPSKTMLDRVWTEMTKSFAGVKKQRLSYLEKEEFTISKTLACSVFLKYSMFHPMTKIGEVILSDDNTVFSVDVDEYFKKGWLEKVSRDMDLIYESSNLT